MNFMRAVCYQHMQTQPWCRTGCNAGASERPDLGNGADVTTTSRAGDRIAHAQLLGLKALTELMCRVDVAYEQVPLLSSNLSYHQILVSLQLYPSISPERPF